MLQSKSAPVLNPTSVDPDSESRGKGDKTFQKAHLFSHCLVKFVLTNRAELYISKTMRKNSGAS